MEQYVLEHSISKHFVSEHFFSELFGSHWKTFILLCFINACLLNSACSLNRDLISRGIKEKVTHLRLLKIRLELFVKAILYKSRGELFFWNRIGDLGQFRPVGQFRLYKFLALFITISIKVYLLLELCTRQNWCLVQM